MFFASLSNIIITLEVLAMNQKNVKRHPVPQARRGTEAKSSDPYAKKGGIPEPAKCSVCEAVYRHKRWYSKGDPAVIELQNGSLALTVCPACRKTQEHFPGGIVTLRGEFLESHKDQILHQIRNEEARAKGNNPQEGIISIKETERRIEIHTTSEKFAQRIGKEIHRAYKGEVNYNWTPDDKFVRVEWFRGAEKED